MIVRGPDSRRYLELVASFPVLGGRNEARGLAPAPGVMVRTAYSTPAAIADDFVDLELLDRWGAHFDVSTPTRGPFPGSGAVEAVRFVLAVWSTRHAWRVGTFDMFRALDAWDHEQIAAFQDYVARPFRP